MSQVFTLKRVSKSFANVRAVLELSLSVPAGRVTALIGPSGCGKSTLLKLLLGLHTPDQGHVLFDGARLDAQSLTALRQRVGYVTQSGGLFPHLTAKHNIVLMARHRGVAEAAIDTRVDELCELTHFPADALSRYPAELSGGQRQRVALMRALMLSPEVLCLDEPLGALDTIIRHDLQQDLKTIFADHGMTVVMVTHDIAEAGYLGDNLVLMSAGEIVQEGSIEDLATAPATPFVTQFLTAQRSLADVLPAGHRPGEAGQ